MLKRKKNTFSKYLHHCNVRPMLLLRNMKMWQMRPLERVSTLSPKRVHHLKGELKRFFFYRLKIFIGPKLRQVSKGNFHRKAPKWVKNQVKGSKIDQIRTKCPQSYWGNPPILSSELLRESINSVLRATEGIHLLTISASDLLRESTDSVLRATEGIHQFCPQSYWGNP